MLPVDLVWSFGAMLMTNPNHLVATLHYMIHNRPPLGKCPTMRHAVPVSIKRVLAGWGYLEFPIVEEKLLSKLWQNETLSIHVSLLSFDLA